MAIIRQPYGNSISPSIIALTSLNLYLERVKSVTEKLRADNLGLKYIPLQFGGLSGQQESLLANSVVKIIDFKITSDE
jgi:hypothetical protein